MRTTAVPFLLSLILGIAAPAVQSANWVVVQTVESRGSVPSIFWRAQIIEEDAANKRSAAQVGNLGDTENWNRRIVLIELAGERPGTWTRRRSYQVPSRTVSGDPCSVRSVDLSKEHGALALTVMYNFACGAGSATSVLYKIDVKPRADFVMSVQWEQSSRDRATSIEVDYKVGNMRAWSGAPEDEAAGTPRIQIIKKGEVVLGRMGLLRCPRPLLGSRMESCRARE